jgi:hypothetical protein
LGISDVFSFQPRARSRDLIDDPLVFALGVGASFCVGAGFEFCANELSIASVIDQA